MGQYNNATHVLQFQKWFPLSVYIFLQTADRVHQQQKVYADKAITEITDYFFSLHNVLQSAEQELLVSVRNHYLKFRAETENVQKELAISERNLTVSLLVYLIQSSIVLIIIMRSICLLFHSGTLFSNPQRSLEQFKTFEIAVPKATLLSDLIKDMKKSLHTAPVTAHFQEPTENPFQFRECNPLRKEIHNYFALEVKPTSYRPKLEPFYAPEPFPVLEPIKSPELPHSPEPGPTPGSSRAAEAESETLNKSTASSSHTVKDMEISRISEEPDNASERELPREQHTHGFVKKPKDKKHKTTKDRHHVHRSSRASQDEASSNVSVYGKVSSTTSMRVSLISLFLKIL